METQAQILTETYHGFKVEELSKAFDLVKPESHWKDPIYSYCTSDEIKVVAAAIRFYTATEAKFDYIGICKRQDQRFQVGDHILRVLAKGYRAGPAGDH